MSSQQAESKYFQPYENSALSFSEHPKRFIKPSLLLTNQALLKQLALDVYDPQALASILSGQSKLGAIAPSSLAYSGHQFGHFNPTLGDGRAHLIGGIKSSASEQYELQLKGSGATRFSRGGDGLCGIGPAVREFVMSQAMDSLNIPTTRCVSVVTTGETVLRKGEQPGAVVCRVAQSHVRIGTIQYLAMQQQTQEMWSQLNELGERFYDLKVETLTQVAELFRLICERLIGLVVEWLRVGFIHGVMNTDNILLSGETIDYGPCAMMEAFDFNTVFSSIDQQGRYAYGNQANIMKWNCARLAEALLVLWDDEQQAVEVFSGILNDFDNVFHAKYQTMWAAKLGIENWHEGDQLLLQSLLDIMQKEQLDFTNTFAALTNLTLDQPNGELVIPSVLNDWRSKWLKRRVDKTISGELMRNANPILVPRNALLEAEIERFIQQGESDTLAPWLDALQSPYDYQNYPSNWLYSTSAKGYQTFCGT
ncbi:protein adenylyltransferase SelO family protein [Pseudoalteromonas sp. T1lg65]|uniref:protein adenylyltransferase SelO family protein n=1 Tax=Pseudoalteromonas sp. T1lg65 TaxID=2077101 RepID=UPI003F798855